MNFANEHDIERWQQRYCAANGYPNAGMVADNLAALADWANDTSDGWHSWPKPVRAASRMIEALQGLEDRERKAWSDKEPDFILAEVRSTLVPVRSFLTRQGVAPDDVLLYSEKVYG